MTDVKDGLIVGNPNSECTAASVEDAATVFTISSLIIPSGISGFWRLAAAEDLNSTSPDSSVLMNSADPAPAQAVYQRDF